VIAAVLSTGHELERARRRWRELWRAARVAVKRPVHCAAADVAEAEALEVAVSAVRGRSHWGAAEGFFDWLQERANVAARTRGETRAWRLGWLDGDRVLSIEEARLP
jgi:hypothetical protein